MVFRTIFSNFFLHRYAAHQTYTMSKFGEKLCFILTWITQGSNYLSAYGYGVMHRMHHAFCRYRKRPAFSKIRPKSTGNDVENENVYQQINKQKIAIEEKFTKNVPQWKSFDKFASSWYSRIGWGAFYTIFFIIFQNIGGIGYYYLWLF